MEGSCSNGLLVNVMTCTQAAPYNNRNSNDYTHHLHLAVHAMDNLVKAADQSRDGHTKKSMLHLTETLKECDCNEQLFESKLLQLDFQDLEMLFVALFASEKKRKGSRTLSSLSFKKRCSVGDVSYINDGYDGDFKNLEQGTSGWGRGKKKVQGNNDDGEVCLLVLRKAYKLKNNLETAEKKDELLKMVLEKHMNVSNYHACALLLCDNEDKYTETFISILNEELKDMIYNVCMDLVSNIWNKGTIPEISESNKCTRLCILATRLVPTLVTAHASLSKIYKLMHETKRAYQCATSFLQHVDGQNDHMMLMLVMCQVDEGKSQSVLKRFKTMEENGMRLSRNMVAVRGVLLIMKGAVEQGIKILIDMLMNEERSIITGVVELMLRDQLLLILANVKLYAEKSVKENMNCGAQNIAEEKILVKLIRQIVSQRYPNDLSLVKINTDCLVLCEDFAIVEDYLSQQIHLHPNEILPMVYLANARIQVGCYNAACEDFCGLLKLSGEEKLMSNLCLLSQEERLEVARVHRLHGFRYLEKERNFENGAECFTVAICAIGKSAMGLVLARGFCHMHLNNFQSAAKDFEYCLCEESEDTPVLCARAILYAATTHVEEALRDFHVAFSSDVTSCYQSLLKLPVEHVTTFSQLLIQFVKQEIQRSHDTRTNSICFDSERSQPTGTDIDVRVLNYSEFLCNLFPDNLDYWLARIACVHISYGSSPALYELNPLLEKFPQDNKLVTWKGVLLAHQRKPEDAIQVLKDVENDDETNSILSSYLNRKLCKQLQEVILRKAVHVREQECYDDAVELYNLSLLLGRDNLDTISGRMECFAKLGQTKKWLTDLNKVMSLNPTSDHACKRAQYYLSQGDEVKACEDFMTALELNENHTTDIVTMTDNIDVVSRLFHTRALTLLEARNFEQAYAYCEAGLKFTPNDKNLKHTRERSRLNTSKCSLQ